VHPAVVIPVHKADINAAEKASLRQVFKVLGCFPMIVVCPQSMDATQYLEVADRLLVERFEDDWFESFRRHQRLMISPNFYERFQSYSHVLVYHLDSWVFRDELLQWCSTPFDYIGAPWRSGFDVDGTPQFLSAGNGGFSLRSVGACLRTLELFDGRRYRGLRELLLELRFRKGGSAFRHLVALPLKLAGIGNSLKRFHQAFPYTEDKFWAHSAGVANPEFRVAPVDVAKHFAFEASPQCLFEQLDHTLPFGCHAWRYEQPFWTERIGLPPDHDFLPHNERGEAILRNGIE